MWNAKSQLSIWKTSQMDRKMAKTIMTTAAAWVHRNRKGDGLGSENVVSIKLKSVATLPLATASPGFL